MSETIKQVKKQKRKASWLKKRVESTLDWIDVYDVRLNGLILKKGKQEQVIKGIKISPHDIFLDTLENQAARVNQLRHVFNKLNFQLYHGFVHNPVNIDEHLERLKLQLELETDHRVIEMLKDDIEKARHYSIYSRELEFYIMIKGKNDKSFAKNFTELYFAFKRAGFHVSELNKLDFENYLANIFENPLINDYYFSRGDFQILFDIEKEKELDEPIQE